MKIEFEAKFLAVDIPTIQNKLMLLGASKTLNRTLLCRQTFDFTSNQSVKKWVRVRKEGNLVTITLKIVSHATIDGTQEIELIVNDFEKACELLLQCGLKPGSYQENYRENWQYQDIIFSIDTWPGLQPFLEIEGPNEHAIQSIVHSLGLDYSNAYFGTIDKLYEREFEIPASAFNTIAKLTFENAYHVLNPDTLKKSK
jgi:adenylate cyclase class 2